MEDNSSHERRVLLPSRRINNKSKTTAPLVYSPCLKRFEKRTIQSCNDKETPSSHSLTFKTLGESGRASEPNGKESLLINSQTCFEGFSLVHREESLSFGVAINKAGSSALFLVNVDVISW